MEPSYIERVTKAYGLDGARELSLFQVEQVYAMKEVAEKEKLNCDLILTRCMETLLSQSHADESKATYEKELSDGLDFINDVDYIGLKFAETVSPDYPIFRSTLLDTESIAAFWNQRSQSRHNNDRGSALAVQIRHRPACSSNTTDIDQCPNTHTSYVHIDIRARLFHRFNSSRINSRPESGLRN